MDTYPHEVEHEEPVYKTVKTGTKRIVRWITSDGQYHGTKKAAEGHQKKIEADLKRKLLWESIRMKDLGSFDAIDLPSVFYFAENQEQLDLIVEQTRIDTYSYHYLNGTTISSRNKPRVGDWIGHTYRDGGDYRDEFNWYTLEFVTRKLSEFLDKASE